MVCLCVRMSLLNGAEMFMLAFKRNSKCQQGSWMVLILAVCKCGGSWGVCVCVSICSQLWLKQKSSGNESTHTQAHLSPQTHIGALIHCRDYQWSMTGLTLGCTGVCLCLSVPSYWDASLCAHTQYVSGWSCLYVYFCACGRFERRQKWKKTWRRRNQSGAMAKREKVTTQTRECIISL